jgi:hypothetical protein
MVSLSREPSFFPGFDPDKWIGSALEIAQSDDDDYETGSHISEEPTERTTD